MPDSVAALRLPAEQLTRQFSPELFAQAHSLGMNQSGVLGQQRAIDALAFGVGMRQRGYNVFVKGELGTGRFSYTKRYLQAQARHQAAPCDSLYLPNFDDARAPIAVQLPAGVGKQLADDFAQLLDQLVATFPAVFETPLWQQQKTAIERNFNQRYDAIVDELEKQALKASIALFREPGNLGFAPMRDGKVLEDNEFAQLDDEVRSQYQQTISQLEEQLNDQLANLPQWKRESNNQLRGLNEQTIQTALIPLLEPLLQAYASYPAVLQYVQGIQQHLLRHAVEQLVVEETSDSLRRQWLARHYAPNLLVSHASTQGAPVIYEANPSYENLFGRTEYIQEPAGLTTDYQQIKAGALHRANGGYLLLQADKVLMEPFVWEALKRALTTEQLKIESPLLDTGRFAAITLDAQQFGLQVKVILIGTAEWYYNLQDYDEEFAELFRVLADFEQDVPLLDQHLLAFINLLNKRVAEEQLAPLTACGMQRLALHSVRLAEHQQRLSAAISEVFQVVSEADYWRAQQGVSEISAQHIEQAIGAKQQRNGKVAEHILQDMLDGVILIETEGTAIGQCNGLTVMDVGDFEFGIPARISAAVYTGSGGVVDIEREVNLGQSIHSKGVLILNGFLGNRYAQKYPLDISASVAMEQSYGYIDGDSASLGETCALISGLARVPLRQDLAITGSINQLGQVQAVGGLNEKIEGFFKLCQARGLTGTQGVIIPACNQVNLILAPEVIQAVAEQKFAIYAVETVDQALTLLTTQTVGVADEQGEYPLDSVHGKVIARLQAIAEAEREDEEKEDEKEQAEALESDNATHSGSADSPVATPAALAN